MRRRAWLAAAGAIVGLIVGAPPAPAEVVAVADRQVAPIETAGDGPYLQLTARVQGVVVDADGGRSYDVPLRVRYPARAARCAGVATVEGRHQGGRADVGTGSEDFPSRHGWTQFAYGWDSAPDAGAGAGSLGRPSDAFVVMADVVGLARDPSAFLPGVCAADRVLGFGTSRTAILLRAAAMAGVAHGLFDAIVLNGAGAFCHDLSGSVRRYVVCPGATPAGLPAATVNSEFDVERLLGWQSRGEGDHYRVYEVAGTPHVMRANVDVMPLGGRRQNPTSAARVVAAMLRALDAHVRTGRALPPSVFIAGAPAAWTDLVPRLGCPACERFEPARDADGNALGGVRLPHVVAPIGTYGGVETDLADVAPANRALVSYGGTFAAFGTERVKTDYPTRGAYVKAVRAAATAARHAGHLSEHAVGRYAAEAAQAYTAASGG